MEHTAIFGLFLAVSGIGFALVCQREENAEASPLSRTGAAGTGACRDADRDGYCAGPRSNEDCDDRDPSVHPGAREICNYRDDDCNALVDDAVVCEAPSIDSSPVRVDKGTFLMGSDSGADDESPPHTVFVSAVAVDRHEVTNRQYRLCVKSGVCKPPSLLSSNRRKAYYDNPLFADYPVIFVDWSAANTYCRFVGGRLPTEAEWEKTARGDDGLPREFPWGDGAPTCALANMGGKGGCVGDTDRVGRRIEGASPYGALDMAGNVWEWVSDWYGAAYYDESPTTNPVGPEEGSLKVMRGGCWQSGGDSLRVTCRKAALPSTWAPNVGFRCAYEKEVRP
jgi:formylglycine-generating enzyme required for sulfatase activity